MTAATARKKRYSSLSGWSSSMWLSDLTAGMAELQIRPICVESIEILTSQHLVKATSDLNAASNFSLCTFDFFIWLLYIMDFS